MDKKISRDLELNQIIVNKDRWEYGRDSEKFVLFFYRFSILFSAEVFLQNPLEIASFQEEQSQIKLEYSVVFVVERKLP